MFYNFDIFRHLFLTFWLYDSFLNFYIELWSIFDIFYILFWLLFVFDYSVWFCFDFDIFIGLCFGFFSTIFLIKEPGLAIWTIYVTIWLTLYYMLLACSQEAKISWFLGSVLIDPNASDHLWSTFDQTAERFVRLNGRHALKRLKLNT